MARRSHCPGALRQARRDWLASHSSETDGGILYPGKFRRTFRAIPDLSAPRDSLLLKMDVSKAHDWAQSLRCC